jgi:hypothetical protein
MSQNEAQLVVSSTKLIGNPKKIQEIALQCIENRKTLKTACYRPGGKPPAKTPAKSPAVLLYCYEKTAGDFAGVFASDFFLLLRRFSAAAISPAVSLYFYGPR